MTRRLLFALLVSFALFGAGVVQAGPVVLAPGSMWEYTFTDPTLDASWKTTTGTAGWLTGPAPFGNQVGPYGADTAGDFSRKTLWAADTSGKLDDDLWVRTSVDLAGHDLSTAHWYLGVDNGFKLYVNGTLIAGANAEGYTSRWEYSGVDFKGALSPGKNIIAVALEDHGGLTAFDMQLTAAETVPDGGATLALLGCALVALGALRRKL